MKFTFALFLALSMQAKAELNGTWKLTSYIYDGQSLPLPNPDLDLRFVFYGNGVADLRWFRRNESGFCESRSHYQIEGTKLHQKIFWINPKNDVSCGDDPEMRLNTETFTEFHREGRTLFLDLALDDKPFIYVLSLLPDELGLGHR